MLAPLRSRRLAALALAGVAALSLGCASPDPVAPADLAPRVCVVMGRQIPTAPGEEWVAALDCPDSVLVVGVSAEMWQRLRPGLRVLVAPGPNGTLRIAPAVERRQPTPRSDA